MTQFENKELSWAERPLRELLRLAWPIAVSMLSYSVMTLVDGLLVGRLGSAELAGVGLGGTTAIALLCFTFGMMRGAKTLVAQAIGAGRPEESGAFLAAAALVALAIGVVLAGAGQFVAAWLVRVAATEASGEAARTYLSVRILGAPMVLVYVALREVRYGHGDARSPMVASVAANLIHVGLAYVFIFRLGWGVGGAAWATVISHGVEAGVLIAAQFRHGWGLSAMRAEHVRALWRLGAPTGLQFSLEIGAFALLSGMIAALSEVEMAAHQIALQVIHFSFLPALSVAEAASVLVGQAVGARRDELVHRVSRLGLYTALVYTGAFTILLAFGAKWIVAGFTDAEGLSSSAVRLLHVAMVFLVFDGANEVARSSLRGAGDVRYPAVVGVVSAWVLTPPLTWLLGYKLGLGALGGWLGLCAEIMVGSAILWRRLERRDWARA